MIKVNLILETGHAIKISILLFGPLRTVFEKYTHTV